MAAIPAPDVTARGVYAYDVNTGTRAWRAWDLADLDKQVGSYFEDRDPSVCFAADSVMQLQPEVRS